MPRKRIRKPPTVKSLIEDNRCLAANLKHADAAIKKLLKREVAILSALRPFARAGLICPRDFHDTATLFSVGVGQDIQRVTCDDIRRAAKACSRPGPAAI